MVSLVQDEKVRQMFLPEANSLKRFAYIGNERCQIDRCKA